MVKEMEYCRLPVILITGFFLQVPQLVKSSAGNEWHYRGMRGPDHWHVDYPHCGGTKQSPISIVTDDVILDEHRLNPIMFVGYDRITAVNMTLTNNGHTVQVNLNEKTRKIRGGGLPGVFVAEQFHFHWGAVDSRGSEHDIDGRFFPMEMHVVHFNEAYGTFTEAMDKEDGLAVLAFFFQVGPFNSHFEKLIDHFRDIHFKDKHSSLQSIPLTEFIPSNLEAYYRYQGSLTTPPCYESVTWTLFHEKIQVAEEQLEAFRTMIFGVDQPSSEGAGFVMDISDDYRPLQCLHNRKVYASRKTLKTLPLKSPIGASNRLDYGYVVVLSCLMSVLNFG